MSRPPWLLGGGCPCCGRHNPWCAWCRNPAIYATGETGPWRRGHGNGACPSKQPPPRRSASADSKPRSSGEEVIY